MLPNNVFYKLVPQNGILWNGIEIKVGSKLECENFSFSNGDGFGYGVGDNPALLLDYLPYTIYKRIMLVESLGSILPIRNNHWRCQSINVLEELSWLDVKDVNDSYHSTCSTERFVSLDEKCHSLNTGVVESYGAIIDSHDSSIVHAKGCTVVTAYGSSTVHLYDQSLCFSMSRKVKVVNHNSCYEWSKFKKKSIEALSWE